MQQTERLESGSAQSAGREVHPVYGLTVVSCEHADLRQSPTGVAVYNDDGVEERPGRPWLGVLATELIEMARRLHGDPAVPRITCDGVWGQETLRICLAILESARVGQAASLASTSVRRWRP
jgi:phthalate 4,5-cis-dihydrodiol dehydrogenase